MTIIDIKDDMTGSGSPRRCKKSEHSRDIILSKFTSTSKKPAEHPLPLHLDLLLQYFLSSAESKFFQIHIAKMQRARKNSVGILRSLRRTGSIPCLFAHPLDYCLPLPARHPKNKTRVGVVTLGSNTLREDDLGGR